MAEKLTGPLNRKDLELYLEINNKVIELNSGVAEQNEEIIEHLDVIRDVEGSIETKIDKLVLQGLEKVTSQCEQISRDLFMIKVLYITGLLSIIAQIVSLFVHH
jgi:hypothetical protein